jgi:hypothetical protein
MTNSEHSHSESRQGWELLATPGHVLLERINAGCHKHKLPMAAIAICIAVGIGSYVYVPFLTAYPAKAIGWVVGKVSNVVAKKPMEANPAPRLRQIRGLLPQAQFDPTAVMGLEQASTLFQSKSNLLLAGLPVDCPSAGLITEFWTDGVDLKPKCRLSADRTRLWEYGFAKRENPETYGAYMFLSIVKDNKVSVHNVAVPNVMRSPTFQAMFFPDRIPRALAADFPELKD